MLLVLNRNKLGTVVVTYQPGEKTEHDLDLLKLPVLWWYFGFFLLSTRALAVMQNFSVCLPKALYGVRFDVASMTLTACMVCGPSGMLMGGFVAPRVKDSDAVVAICMTVGAALLALCGTGICDPTSTMVPLAATGFAVGIRGPSRNFMSKNATPKGAPGRVCRMVCCGLDVAFAISPVRCGVFMDRGWYPLAFFGVALVMF
ncbi:MAG: hypothetical protein H7274_02375 [Rhodoferax sp.]|nr:hypothetical protein [Rhodoferax sp.]